MGLIPCAKRAPNSAALQGYCVLTTEQAPCLDWWAVGPPSTNREIGSSTKDMLPRRISFYRLCRTPLISGFGVPLLLVAVATTYKTYPKRPKTRRSWVPMARADSLYGLVALKSYWSVYLARLKGLKLLPNLHRSTDKILNFRRKYFFC